MMSVSHQVVLVPNLDRALNLSLDFLDSVDSR